MAAVKIASYIALATVFTTCLCLPIKTEKDSDINSEVGKIVLPKDVIEEVIKEAFSQVNVVTISEKDEHIKVKRSVCSSGVFAGCKCPENEWRLPSGECVPCQGQNHEGCPPVDDDYYNDIEETS